MWNYRLVRLGDGQVDLYEVYYTEEGVPFMRTTDPAGVVGDDAKDALLCYQMMGSAFHKPVLDDSVFDSAEAQGALDGMFHE